MLIVTGRAEGDLMRCVSVILSKAWPGAPRLWSSIAAQAEQSVMLKGLSRGMPAGARWLSGGEQGWVKGAAYPIIC